MSERSERIIKARVSSVTRPMACVPVTIEGTA
jgi:hypothetical protein